MIQQSKPPISIILRRIVFSSLTRRIVALNVIALILLLLGLTYIENSSSNLIKNKFVSMQKQASFMSEVFITLNDNFPVIRAMDLIAKLTQQNNIKLKIYNNSGEFIFNNIDEDKSNLINSQQLNAVLHGAERAWKINEDKHLVLNIAIPIIVQHKIIGALQLINFDSDIKKTVQNVNIKILLFTILILSIFSLLSLYLASSIALPLRRLSLAAKQASNFKNPPTIIPQFNNRYDEIDRLAKAIQRMAQAFYNHLEVMESFAQDVSHELKNPIASISSALETLKISTDEKQKTILQNIIMADIKKMNLLITDIADASRIDAELARDSYIYIDLEKMAKNRVQAIEKLNNIKDITFSVCKKTSLPVIVQGHELRLAQVVDNLLTNAISFVPKNNGLIAIMLNATHSNIQIIIEDNGTGIKAKQIDTIFERFYTERTEKSTEITNSGLGLAIVKQIIEAHKGTIRAENIVNITGQNIGARFIINLPKAHFVK